MNGQNHVCPVCGRESDDTELIACCRSIGKVFPPDYLRPGNQVWLIKTGPDSYQLAPHGYHPAAGASEEFVKGSIDLVIIKPDGEPESRHIRLTDNRPADQRHLLHRLWLRVQINSEQGVNFVEVPTDVLRRKVFLQLCSLWPSAVVEALIKPAAAAM